MKKNQPVLLVGGGSGGHIVPLIAIGEELQRLGVPFIFVGGYHGKEAALTQSFGWSFKPIHSGKWRRYLMLISLGQNMVDLGPTVAGFFESLAILLKTGSQTVFSKGGHVALPMVLAAAVLGRRIIIHESDSVMGLTNQLTARFAAQILTAFPVTVFPHASGRYLQVGIPIRQAIRQAAKLKAPKKSHPLILVIGGIQGSRFINDLIARSVTELVQMADVVHVTGDQEAARFEELRDTLTASNKKRYQPLAFLDRKLPYYLQTSDLLISRSGATVIAEAALFSRAVLAIPLPTAAGNHQQKNADHLLAEQALAVATESQLNPKRFLEEVRRLVDNPKRLVQLGQALHQHFYQEQTLNKIISIITDEKEN